jgi:hypothetical protein
MPTVTSPSTTSTQLSQRWPMILRASRTV